MRLELKNTNRVSLSKVRRIRERLRCNGLNAVTTIYDGSFAIRVMDVGETCTVNADGETLDRLPNRGNRKKQRDFWKQAYSSDKIS